MIRALVENCQDDHSSLGKTRTQPIAIEDVIAIDAGVDLKINGSSIIEIGGADQVSYLDLMKNTRVSVG